MTNHTDRKVCLGSSELRAEGEADFACGEKPQKERRVDISLPLYFGCLKSTLLLSVNLRTFLLPKPNILTQSTPDRQNPYIVQILV